MADDGPNWGGVAAAGGGLLGGILGNAFAAGDRDQASALQQQAYDEIKKVQSPELKQAIFEKYKSAGIITPQMEQVFAQDPSLMGAIKTDPRLKDAQMGALSKLQQMGNGGLQPEDVAMLHQIQRQSDQDEQSKQGQILQQMQERGAGGSGNELAARLLSAQSGANRMSQQGDNVASMASQRALQSLMQAGQLGGSIRGQDFGEQSAQAQAQDAINRFNTQNRQGIAGSNVNRANSAQQYNLGNAQQLSNANVDLGNRQTQYNNDLIQQDYLNRLRKAGADYSADQNRAGQYNQNAQRTATQWSGIGQGAGQIGAALYGVPTAAPAAQNQAGNQQNDGSGPVAVDKPDYTKLWK